MSMLAKRLLEKALHKPNNSDNNAQDGSTKNLAEMDVQIAVHYGIPYTASVLAYDPIQHLLAIGTLDGRIKIIGGDNIEALLISPKKVPYKYLEFIRNQGFLVAISNENEIQVWNLEFRQLFDSSQWETNLTAFAIVPGTSLMFLGDENGMFSVLKYDNEDWKIQKMPYQIPLNSLSESAGISLLDPQSIVGILPQPNTFGTRVLIAYEKDILVLWDISENQAISIRGHGDLKLKEKNLHKEQEKEQEEDEEEEEREICSVCWASNAGSVVAVGYITGDIYLWDFSPKSSNKSSNAVKLQLANGDRRLPVIVLHWSASVRGDSDKAGNLFIYGGDEMGSEEVLTVLSIEFPNGLENLRLISRVDLSLSGSFADMILIPDSVSPEKKPSSALFILTNPGQITIYDCTLFSTQNLEGNNPESQAAKFPVLIPTVDPNITVTMLCSLTTKFLKKSHGIKTGSNSLSGGTRWPLTGGVPSEISLSKDRSFERLYIAGYKDGSVRIWDASFPVLELIFVLNGKIEGIGIDGGSVSVSALAFCPLTMTLSVGDECGLVRVYKLHENTEGSTGQPKQEALIVLHGKGFHCDAAAMVQNSPVRTLHFSNSGQILSVGFENGQVAMLEVRNLSVIFCTDISPESNSPVISLLTCAINGNITNTTPPAESPKGGVTVKLPKEPLISLTKDVRISVIDTTSGVTVCSHLLPQKSQSAISMYVIDGPKKDKIEQPKNGNTDQTKTEQTHEQNSKDGSSSTGELLMDQLILICCEDALLLYPLKSILQGESKHVYKVKLAEHCCWSTIFRKVEENLFGLLLIYQTGTLEIRSLPDLEVVSKGSLMSILRWSFKTNMDKTICSSDGQISLVNGSELAIISLLASENAFKIPESFPCLLDKVVAAAAEAAFNASTDHKKKLENAPGILGGIVKGLKAGRSEHSPKFINTQHLEDLLVKSPFADPSSETPDDIEEQEFTIDDIVIDDPEEEPAIPVPAPSAMYKLDINKRTGEEREKLFEGSSDAAKPRVRTHEEILTKYKFKGDANAAAAYAKEKLVQRQEKLERLSQKTEELQSGAENFANMANELVKTMEKKKWWNL